MRINRKQYRDMKDRPLTAQRQLLMDTLREAGGHLDARELYRRASAKDPHISLATVYRNLRLFREIGLVDERRLDVAHCYYEIKRSREHYHLVCRTCGQVMEFESPLVGKLVDDVQRKSDFDVTRTVLYMEGYCRKCRESDRDAEFLLARSANVTHPHLVES